MTDRLNVQEAELEMGRDPETGNFKAILTVNVSKEETDQHPETHPLIIALRRIETVANEMKAEVFNKTIRRAP